MNNSERPLLQQPSTTSRRRFLLGAVAGLLASATTFDTPAPAPVAAQTPPAPERPVLLTPDVSLKFFTNGQRIELNGYNPMGAISPAAVGIESKVGKTAVIKNGTPHGEFSLTEASDLAQGQKTAIGAYAHDVSTGKTYVASAAVNPATGEWFPRGGEILPDITRPNDNRIQITTEGLPQGGTRGNSFEKFVVKEGNEVRILTATIQKSINRFDDGNYMVQLDANGIPTGTWKKMGAEYKAYTDAQGGQVHKVALQVTGTGDFSK